MSEIIPWATPCFWGKERKHIDKALDSNWISGGSYLDKFETQIKTFLNTNHVHTVSNGTTAIHSAFLSINLTKNDEVILPGFGYMAAANIAIQLGIIPKFCDVDQSTWNPTADTIEKCISKKTKAIVVIHNYGNMCDMDPIIKLGKRYKIPIIEDCAESFGSKYNNRASGTIGDIGTFSFHATKTITTGEGGAVVCKKKEVSKKIKLIKSHGVDKKRYWHLIAGHNFRMTNFQAAMGFGQMEKIDTIIKKKLELYEFYKYNLNNIEGISLQKITPKSFPIIWAIGVKIDKKAFSKSRDKIISELLQKKIETRRAFYSSEELVHLYGKNEVPNSVKLSKSLISLPSSPVLTKKQISYICDTLRRMKR